jgi:hypothetical protein
MFANYRQPQWNRPSYSKSRSYREFQPRKDRMQPPGYQPLRRNHGIGNRVRPLLAAVGVLLVSVGVVVAVHLTGNSRPGPPSRPGHLVPVGSSADEPAPAPTVIQPPPMAAPDHRPAQSTEPGRRPVTRASVPERTTTSPVGAPATSAESAPSASSSESGTPAASHGSDSRAERRGDVPGSGSSRRREPSHDRGSSPEHGQQDQGDSSIDAAPRTDSRGASRDGDDATHLSEGVAERVCEQYGFPRATCEQAARSSAADKGGFYFGGTSGFPSGGFPGGSYPGW